MAARTFRKKKQQQSRVFFAVIWEKEQERVIKNKRLRKLRAPKIESVEIWSQIVTEIGQICQIFFCPIL